MMKKLRALSGRRGAGRSDMDAEKIDRLVSTILAGDSGQAADPAGGSADEEVHELLHLIASIRQVGTSDPPLPEPGVDTIMGALERAARDEPRPGAWRAFLGMVAGFLACALTLGSGLLLLGGTGYPGPSEAVATPVLAAAVASLAALASVLVHMRAQLRRPILPLLVLVTLGIGACGPKLPGRSTVEVEIAPSALTTFQEGDELWGVRDIVESGDVIWVLTGAAPFLRAYDRSGRVLADIGRSGEGPGELLNPWILSATGSSGGVVAWDLATRRRSLFDAQGNFVTSTPSPIIRESIRADIRSVTFGDPFRVVDDNTGIWTASYPGGITRGDDFWGGRIVRHAHADSEPTVVVDFAVDLPGAASPSRVPAMGLAPVPLWDRCADDLLAVLDPVDRSLHLYRPGGTKVRQITLPWAGRPLSQEERLGYVRGMMRNETRGTNVSDDEIERAATEMLARAGNHLAAEVPVGIDLRCSPGRIWIQEFDGSFPPLGYGRTWWTVVLDDAGPQFQRVLFPDGFTPFRLTDSVAVGVMTDSSELQRVAVLPLATVTPVPMPARQIFP